MERTLYKKLIDWKNDPRRKPLVLKGARQVGKTWLLKAFGGREFDSLVYLNCDKDENAKALFSDYDLGRIVRSAEALSGKRIVPGRTLLVFDEIQEAPRGLGALKYFCEERPDLHVAVAGSLLGIALHEGTNYPVGKTDELTLFPCSFPEFLRALGEGAKADLLESRRWPEIDSLRTAFVELLRQYFFVGGMPEVVDAYVRGSDIALARRMQATLLSHYRADVSKHAPAREVPRIFKVLDSLPSQLAKENKKFVYGAVKPGGRAKEFEIAIQWLVDAGVIAKVTRCRKAGLPLSFYEDAEVFKLFLLDVGLLGALAKAPSRSILVGDGAFEEYNGAFAENYVLQQLRSAEDVEPHYWTNDNSTAELDFLLQAGERVIPVEVKAGENPKAKSLRTFVGAHPGLRGVRFSLLPRREQEWVLNIPLYGVSAWIAEAKATGD